MGEDIKEFNKIKKINQDYNEGKHELVTVDK